MRCGVILGPVSSEPQQEIAQVDHVALATSQLDALCDFYRRLGGVDLTPSMELADGVRGCVLDFFGVRLEVVERHGEVSPRLVQLGFVLRSADAVDELTRVFAAAGYRVLEPPNRGGLGRYESVLLDPDGNRVKLSV